MHTYIIINFMTKKSMNTVTFKMTYIVAEPKSTGPAEFISMYS